MAGLLLTRPLALATMPAFRRRQFRGFVGRYSVAKRVFRTTRDWNSSESAIRRPSPCADCEIAAPVKVPEYPASTPYYPVVYDTPVPPSSSIDDNYFPPSPPPPDPVHAPPPSPPRSNELSDTGDPGDEFTGAHQFFALELGAATGFSPHSFEIQFGRNRREREHRIVVGRAISLLRHTAIGIGNRLRTFSSKRRFFRPLALRRHQRFRRHALLLAVMKFTLTESGSVRSVHIGRNRR